MYMLTCLFARGKERRLFHSIGVVAAEEDGIAMLAGELDDGLASLAPAAERLMIYGVLYQRLKNAPPPRVGFARADFAGSLGIVIVAVGSALPLLLPLLFFGNNPGLAVRLSNLVAFFMLFYLGFRWAQYAGGKPMRVGALLLLLGAIMVLVAIPLGG